MGTNHGYFVRFVLGAVDYTDHINYDVRFPPLEWHFMRILKMADSITKTIDISSSMAVVTATLTIPMCVGI